LTRSNASADDSFKFAVCIPTYNPGAWVERMVAGIRCQWLQPARVLVVDSSTSDGQVEGFAELGADIVRIEPGSFDHGGTRNLAFTVTDVDGYLFLTQDAIPARPDAFAHLVTALLGRARIGVAYGRHLPATDASPLARAHRSFNYPAYSATYCLTDLATHGVRALFCSNSFALYRREAIVEIGGFPSRILTNEDRWAAARLLQRGWEVRYAADACVIHSHEQSPTQQFRRYFDTGAFEAQHPWFGALVGGPSREGIRMLRHQTAHLTEEGVSVPALRVVAHATMAWTGYRAGRLHRLLPRRLCARLSGNRAFWSP
jgi:rhamnosyltransferase